MSMISGLIDELNKSADEWNSSNMFELARMCRDAADTIWQLRDDLQRANAENTKLRELVESRKWIACMLGEQTARVVNLQELAQDMFDGMCDHDCCDICPHWQEGYNGCEYHARMRELGMEVDG